MRNTSSDSVSIDTTLNSNANERLKSFLEFKENIIPSCPECGHSQIYRRTRAKNWKCSQCGAVFKDPVPKRSNSKLRAKSPSYLMPKGAKA